MTQRSKLGALFISTVMLCSCGTAHAVVADHNIGGMELTGGIVTVHSEAVPAPEIQPRETDEPDKTGEEPEFIAVMLPEKIEAEAMPIPEVRAERVPEVTEEPEAAVTMLAPAEEAPATAVSSEPSVSINSSMLALTSSPKKYTYEQQKTKGSVLLLGANLVYVGESFDFDYIYPDKKPDTDMFWSVIGSGGSIDQNGVFTAKERSVCTVTATDRDTGAFASMKVHCIVNADDVDFIPLVNGIPIANKTYPLPKDYDPGLDTATHNAFIRMQNAAKAEGLTIYPVSAYRGYSYQ
ncbi:MAG: hypothetical protein IK093_06540, partial [Ruminiclostridium sp.]|nr:hypothetical protein [Ruminiclostridium sp.]